MEGLDLNFMLQNAIAVSVAVWVIREGMAVNLKLLEVLTRLTEKMIEVCDEGRKKD